jgi:hypothetical protein
MAAKISVYNNEEKGVSETSQDTQCQAFQDKDAMAGDLIDSFTNTNTSLTLSAETVVGTRVTPTVECFVDNCAYWNNGNACTASTIEVNGINADRKSDTDCETFVLR